VPQFRPKFTEQIVAQLPELQRRGLVDLFGENVKHVLANPAAASGPVPWQNDPSYKSNQRRTYCPGRVRGLTLSLVFRWGDTDASVQPGIVEFDLTKIILVG
jgi:hypothetical protein